MFSLFSLFRAPADSQVIDRGRVNCPPRGQDVEMDVCAGCQWMTEIDEKGNPPFVRCHPKMPPVIAEVEYRHGHMLY